MSLSFGIGIQPSLDTLGYYLDFNPLNYKLLNNHIKDILIRYRL
jgi:hypothetical protein